MKQFILMFNFMLVCTLNVYTYWNSNEFITIFMYNTGAHVTGLIKLRRIFSLQVDKLINKSSLLCKLINSIEIKGNRLTLEGIQIAMCQSFTRDMWKMLTFKLLYNGRIKYNNDYAISVRPSFLTLAKIYIPVP